MIKDELLNKILECIDPKIRTENGLLVKMYALMLFTLIENRKVSGKDDFYNDIEAFFARDD